MVSGCTPESGNETFRHHNLIGHTKMRNKFDFLKSEIKTRHGRNQHSLAFQIPSVSKDVYMYSFFPQTIRDWNDLPESLISSSELSDDRVSKFTSLVKARD